MLRKSAVLIIFALTLTGATCDKKPDSTPEELSQETTLEEEATYAAPEEPDENLLPIEEEPANEPSFEDDESSSSTPIDEGISEADQKTSSDEDFVVQE